MARSVKSEPSMEIGVYGKLPLSREYLRVNCFNGVANRYREWIDEGFEKAAASRSTLGATWQVLFLPEDEEELILSVLRDSTDGLRTFPFSCFSRISDIKATATEVVDRMSCLWKQLDRCSLSLAELPDTSSLKEEVEGLVLELPEKEEISELLQMKVQDFVRELFGESQDQEEFSRFLWDLRQALIHVHHRVKRGQEAPTMRIPLAPGLDASGQAQLWLHFLESNQFASGQRMSLAFPQNGTAGGSLFLFPHPLRAEDFCHLGAGFDGLVVLSGDEKAMAETRGYPIFRSEVEAMLLQPDSRLEAVTGFKVI